MKLKYEIDALPIKLTREIESINENHRILYYDGYVEIELFDLRVVDVTQLNGVTNEIEIINSYFERRTFEEQIDSDGNNNIVEVWNIDESFSTNQINIIIQNHNPSTKYVTEEQQRILDLEMIIADMMGV